MDLKTLKEMNSLLVLERLRHFDWNRAKTSKSLGVCARTTRNHIDNLREMGYAIERKAKAYPNTVAKSWNYNPHDHTSP